MRVVKFHDERRQEIIETARRLFLLRGVEQTSVSSICREIGVAHGLVYYYFKSKEDILHSVLAQMLSRFTAKIEDTLERKDCGYPYKLYTVLHAFFDVYAGYNASVLPENRLLQMQNEQIAAYLHGIGQRLYYEGIESGYFLQKDSFTLLRIVVSGSLRLLEKESMSHDALLHTIFDALHIPIPDMTEPGV